MQQTSTKKHMLNRTGAGLALVFALCMPVPLPGDKVWAQEIETTPATMTDFYPAPLIAFTDRPDFLDCTSTAAEPERWEEETFIPFFGADQVLTPLPTPERPAISASDVGALIRPEVMAGVNVNLGTVKFNLGYTLPSRQIDELIRPLGVDLEPGVDAKCFSLGVEIPF